MSNVKQSKQNKSQYKNKVKKARMKVASGIVCITASFNNIIVTITDQAGNALETKSAGGCGYRGAKKSTPLAAQEVSSIVSKAVQANYGMKTVDIKLIGPGAGREAAVKAVQAAGLIINSLMDITPTPHNGCRPPKRRRV